MVWNGVARCTVIHCSLVHLRFAAGGLLHVVIAIISDLWDQETWFSDCHSCVGRCREVRAVSTYAKLLAQVGSAPRRIDHVSAPVDRGEVLRYLGYPAAVEPNLHLREILDEWMRKAARRATPRAVYAVFRVTELRPRGMRLQTPAGEVEFHGAVGEFLGPSECIAAFIATAGSGVERLASELMQQGDHLAAMIVNAVGAERAESAEAMVIEQLREQAKEHAFIPTLPYSPGYCGMALTEQRTLFSLFGDIDTGVTLTESCLMRPLKSVSGLIGLGPAERVADFGSPCDRCELYTCAMRR